MIIKKIFEGNFDDEVRNGFLKFGRGEFKDKFLIEAKKQASKWSVKTGPEFANFFVRKCLERVGEDEKIEMKGVIVTTEDLRGEVNFQIIKQKNFQGVKQLVIDDEVPVNLILELMDRHPRVFFALSFKTPDCELKIKPKPPKSAKPGEKTGEGPKADFCRLKTSDKELMTELFFDVGLNWKEIKIKHTIKVDDIIYPKDVSPEEMREKSKRKGVVVRMVDVDGRGKGSEAGFEV